MAGLLDGLGNFGLKDVENMDLYEEPAKDKSAGAPSAPKAPVVSETDFLFDKKYECPVCGENIKARTLRAGKARLLHSDMDLRPVYEHIEPLKYDVILCPHCGYAALSRFFTSPTASQIKEIKENISGSFKASIKEQDTYTYEEALYRYKLSLANTIVKHGKPSEKAYICLKTGWLLRSWQEKLRAEQDQEASGKLAGLKEQERSFLKNALDGFLAARENENYPMCGMDETTVEYLIAVLAMEFDQCDISSRIISSILASPTASSRMKDKARDVKEQLLVKMKEKN